MVVLKGGWSSYERGTPVGSEGGAVGEEEEVRERVPPPGGGGGYGPVTIAQGHLHVRGYLAPRTQGVGRW